MLLQILLLAVLLVFSGFFSGVEVALVSLNDLKIRNLLKQKRKGAEDVRKLKKKPQRMIITILIGNNIVNISASVLASIIATELFGSSGAGIAIGVMTFLVLVFGEIMPKAYASLHAENISLKVARPLLILQKALYPFVLFFERITKSGLKLFGGEPESKALITEEELKTAFEVGAEEQVIEEGEKELLHNVLQFNDITAKEVMTVKSKVFSLNASMKVEKAIPLVAKSPFSRIPLFESSKEDIVGVIHTKDVVEAVYENEHDFELKEIAVKPYTVKEDIIIDKLFKLFQKNHLHIAIVIDEDDDFIGIVTLEDLLEEIVGEIIDESDVTPERIMRIDKNTVLVDGETEPSYVNSFFNVKIPLKYEDVSSYLLDKLGKKPKRGKKIKIDGKTFIVEELGEDHIERVVIKKE